MARLVTAPIPAWAPLAAKALTAVLVGIASMTALAVATTLLVGADWGHPLGVGMLVVTAVLAATGVVGLVASFTRTPESASAALGVVGTVLGALGGAFFPLRDVGVLAAVSAVTPHHWFLQGLTRLAGGAPPGDVVGPAMVLLLIAAVTAVVAVVRLQRTQGV
jgi:ABC-2 type transport system permease protein